ncbi:MAG: hypothetical protein HY319_03440 [Armatimonadetes bacterium]|nr:hypothetical protein [Armatimonadota bacterium]
MAFYRSLKTWFARYMGLLPSSQPHRTRTEPQYRPLPPGQTECPQCLVGTIRCIQERSPSGALREFFDCPFCGARFQPPWGSYSRAEQLLLRQGTNSESSDEYQWC